MVMPRSFSSGALSEVVEGPRTVALSETLGLTEPDEENGGSAEAVSAGVRAVVSMGAETCSGMPAAGSCFENQPLT